MKLRTLFPWALVTVAAAAAVFACVPKRAAPVTDSEEQEALRRGGAYVRKHVGNAIESIRENLKLVDFAKYAVSSGLITGLNAKNVCSCVFVQRLPDDLCRELANVYSSNILVTAKISRISDPNDPQRLLAGKVETEGRFDRLITSIPRVATYDASRPRLGCVLDGEYAQEPAGN